VDLEITFTVQLQKLEVYRLFK